MDGGIVSEYLRTHLTNWPMRRFRPHEVHTFFQDIGASSRFFSRCLYAARPIFYTVGRLMVPITEISCCETCQRHLAQFLRKRPCRFAWFNAKGALGRLKIEDPWAWYLTDGLPLILGSAANLPETWPTPANQ